MVKYAVKGGGGGASNKVAKLRNFRQVATVRCWLLGFRAAHRHQVQTSPAFGMQRPRSRSRERVPSAPPARRPDSVREELLAAALALAAEKKAAASAAAASAAAAESHAGGASASVASPRRLSRFDVSDDRESAPRHAGPSSARLSGDGDGASEGRERSAASAAHDRIAGGGGVSSRTTPAWLLHNSFVDGCRSVSKYRPVHAIEEGTYGKVWLAVDKETGERVALKQIKFDAVSSNEGFPVTALREVGTLLELAGHPNIVRAREMVVGATLDKVYMVMDFAPHNVRDWLDRLPAGASFTVSEVKCLVRQLLLGLAHCHSRWIMHRDLKPANLLISPDGTLQLCDFGLARKFGDPPRPATETVVTLWYRAPEVLLGRRDYGPAIDLWAAGCIFAEFLTRAPLFHATNEADAVNLIFQLRACQLLLRSSTARCAQTRALNLNHPPHLHPPHTQQTTSFSLQGARRRTLRGLDGANSLMCDRCVQESATTRPNSCGAHCGSALRHTAAPLSAATLASTCSRPCSSSTRRNAFRRLTHSRTRGSRNRLQRVTLVCCRASRVSTRHERETALMGGGA